MLRRVLLLVAAVALTASLVACSDDDGALPGGEELLTTPFETFDGEQRTLAEFEGTPLVVNFFAEWCAPCVTEMPEFEEVHQELGDRVMIVGLDYDDTREKGLEIIERTGVTYLVGRDVSGALFTAAKGYQMPTTVFVRADGTVAHVRSMAMDADELRELIRKELGVS